MAVGQHHGPVGEGVLQPRYKVHHSLKLYLRIVVVPRMHPGKDWHLAQMTPLERGGPDQNFMSCLRLQPPVTRQDSDVSLVQKLRFINAGPG